jgi:hypothetical protein
MDWLVRLLFFSHAELSYDGCWSFGEKGVSFALFSSLPLEIQLPVGRCTISQVKVDEALIRNAHILGNGLEVIDALLIQTDRDLLLELRSVGVPGRF